MFMKMLQRRFLFPGCHLVLPLVGDHPKLSLIPTVKDSQGVRTVRRNRDLYKFHGKTFTSDGFEIKTFRTSDLDDVDVLPKEKELVFFDESDNEDVQHAIRVVRSNVQFGVSDKVLICLGVLQGTLGCIISIDNTETAQIETFEDHLLVEMPQRHLRRAFSCGDYVTIISGEHQGRGGFITELNGELVTLYMPVGELGPQNPVGEEVFEPALAILHISDFCSFKLNRCVSIGRRTSTHPTLNRG